MLIIIKVTKQFYIKKPLQTQANTKLICKQSGQHPISFDYIILQQIDTKVEMNEHHAKFCPEVFEK